MSISGRRAFPNPALLKSTIYVDNNLGSDITGDGSSTSPYLTVVRALMDPGIMNGATKTVQLVGATETYDIPMTLPQLNWITIKGEQATEDSRTIASVTSASDDSGVMFTVNGTTLADDAWKGRMLHLTGLYSNLRNILVEGNIGNLVWGKMTNRSFTSDIQSTPSGGTVNLLNLTKINLVGTTSSTTSIQMNFQYVDVQSTASWFFNATDKIEFRHCVLNNTLMNAGRGGGLYIISSIVNLVGTANGCVQARNKADVRIGYGTIFTGLNANPGQNFIKVAEDSALVLEGGVGFTDLDGILVDGGNVYSVAQPNLRVVFTPRDGVATSAGYIINSLGVGSGAFYNLPVTKGMVTSDYYVQAELGANVTISSGTAVDTNTVQNAVSADGGATASSRNSDGTIIRGGYPEASAGWSACVSIDHTDSPYTPDLSVVDKIFADTSGGAITINLPPISDYSDGAGLYIKDTGNSSSNPITVNADASDNIEGGASDTINVSRDRRHYSGAGNNWWNLT